MTTDMTIKNYTKVTHDSGTAAGPRGISWKSPSCLSRP